MNSISLQFIRGLRWNTAESVWYQLALIGHQVVLFSLTTPSFYGLIGTLFSIIYLIITVTNFGLDTSLAPFFTLATKNKRLFKRVLLPQLIPELIIFSLVAVILCTTQALLIAIPLVGPHLNSELIGIMGALIIVEGFKKTLRAILQLSFNNHLTALIEMATITLYISIIWLLYFLGHPITLNLIFVPMLMVSVMGTTALSYCVLAWYQHLPNESSDTLPAYFARRLFKSRLFNYANQISHTFFSGNFLVPFFAAQFGLAHAGVFKLLCNIAYGISTVIQKMFGLSTQALLAHVKDMHLLTKQDAFKTITYYLYQVLYAILLFVGINIYKISTWVGTSTNSNALPLIILFFIIHFSEHFFMVYEKFFIIEEENFSLFLFNTSTIALIYGTLSITSGWSPLAVLLAILLIRIATFAALSYMSFYWWRLIPTWQLQPKCLIGALIISLLVWMW
jgi:hypothetical protein